MICTVLINNGLSKLLLALSLYCYLYVIFRSRSAYFPVQELFSISVCIDGTKYGYQDSQAGYIDQGNADVYHNTGESCDTNIYDTLFS
jgi:hypothetical protein